MNWYKKAQTYYKSLSPPLRHKFIEELINKLPKDYTVYKENGKWSVTDEQGRKIVHDEPNMLYALRLALVRWKVINQ